MCITIVQLYNIYVYIYIYTQYIYIVYILYSYYITIIFKCFEQGDHQQSGNILTTAGLLLIGRCPLAVQDASRNSAGTWLNFFVWYLYKASENLET